MDNLLFDAKDITKKNEDQKETHPISLYIVILAGIAMAYILYQKSGINLTTLYDNFPNPIHLVIEKTKNVVLSINQPVIKKNKIQMIRYSYELPKSLDFLYR